MTRDLPQLSCFLIRLLERSISCTPYSTHFYDTIANSYIRWPFPNCRHTYHPQPFSPTLQTTQCSPNQDHHCSNLHPAQLQTTRIILLRHRCSIKRAIRMTRVGCLQSPVQTVEESLPVLHKLCCCTIARDVTYLVTVRCYFIRQVLDIYRVARSTCSTASGNVGSCLGGVVAGRPSTCVVVGRDVLISRWIELDADWSETHVWGLVLLGGRLLSN